MHVTDFREFYASPLGQTAARLINKQLSGLTQARPGETVMGLGYGLPYLPTDKTILSLGFMPARQGVIHWPANHDNCTALVDEIDLPLLESVVDLALVVHGLEHAELPLETLQEVWRVLAPQGRMVLVVPNRRGLWAAAEHTPFGHGQPFSVRQVEGLLREAKFTVTQWRSALFLPPVGRASLLRMAGGVDAVGSRMAQRFSGLIIVEAMKQVYAFSSGKRARRFMPRLRPVLLPSPQPTPRKGQGDPT